MREGVVNNFLLFWGFQFRQSVCIYLGGAYYRDWGVVTVPSGRLEHGGGNVCVHKGSLERKVFLRL